MHGYRAALILQIGSRSKECQKHHTALENLPVSNRIEVRFSHLTVDDDDDDDVQDVEIDEVGTCIIDDDDVTSPAVGIQRHE